jgi:hypothetical protein
MLKPDLLKTAALLLLALAFGAQGAWAAQSGRKGAKSPSPVPSEPAPQGESESESGPKPNTSKRPDALVSFVVMRGDEGILMVDSLARDGVSEQFLRRLGSSQAVSVTNAGAGTRGEARKRAKDETAAYVVLFQLDEEGYGGSTGGTNSRALIIRTLVYAPKTGDLKFTDTVFQRPYRPTARVGGIPVPVPTRGIERYPSQHELEQAARDAADRLLSRFNITPTDN